MNQPTVGEEHKRKRSLSVSAKIILATILVPSIGILATAGILSHLHAKDARESFSEHAVYMGDSAAGSLGLAMALGSSDSMRETLALLQQDPFFLGLVVFDSEGEVLLSEPTDLTIPEQISDTSLGNDQVIDGRLFISQSLNFENEPLGRIVLVLNEARLAQQRLSMVLIALLIAGAAIAVGAVVGLRMSKGIRTLLPPLSTMMAAIAKGDLRERTLPVTGNDELAVLAEAAQAMLQNTRSVIDNMGQQATLVASAAEELTATSDELYNSTESSSESVQRVSQAASNVDGSVGDLLAESRSIAEMIREIAEHAQRVSDEARSAVTVSANASEQMSQLEQVGREIEAAAEQIGSVADQTNLLALNATIEAARAGEAGKGFAVVATEVKELAASAASAAESVGGFIRSIQSGIQSAVGAMTDVSQSISRIDDLQTKITSAVQEQSDSADRMAGNVEGAGNASREIAQSLQTVSQTTQHGSITAESTKCAAQELTRLAEQLSSTVSGFQLQ